MVVDVIVFGHGIPVLSTVDGLRRGEGQVSRCKALWRKKMGKARLDGPEVMARRRLVYPAGRQACCYSAPWRGTDNDPAKSPPPSSLRAILLVLGFLCSHSPNPTPATLPRHRVPVLSCGSSARSLRYTYHCDDLSRLERSERRRCQTLHGRSQ